MIEVLYYKYFQFYRKILRESTPHLYATLTLSFSIFLVVDLVLSIIGIKIFGNVLGFGFRIITYFVVLSCVYYMIYIRNKPERIEVEKPAFFNNSFLSGIIAFFFFLFSFSIMFWGDNLIRLMK
jgi:hypothetical protein